MASSLNRVFLMGNLTRDPELRHTTSNQSVATFGMAMNRRYKTADGQVKEDVTFVDCDAWGKTAEMISQYFTKGRPIFIEGRLRLDTWQDKQDGGNRSKLNVVVEAFHFVDSRPDGGGGGGGGGGAGAGRGGYEGGADAANRPQRQPNGTRPAPGSSPAGPAYESIEETDIPF